MSSPILSRRELLASAGAGAAALLLESNQGQAQPARPPGGLRQHDGRHRRCGAARRGAGGRRRHHRGDRPDRSGPQSLSRRRGLRRPRQGAAARPHQLSRAPGRHHRPRLQRGLRLPEQLPAGGPAGQPAVAGRSHADGDGRRAGGDPHRHAPPWSRTSAASAATAAALAQDRPALRVRRIGHRQRERVADVAGGPGQAARRRASRPSCATRACSASPTCTPPGTARSRAASASSRPPRWPRPPRPNCCRRSAPSPRSTISATRSTCRRAAPKSSSWCGTTA